MTPHRKILGAAAFSLALAGGGVAGAMLGTPSLSGAQDASAQQDDTTAEKGPKGHHKERRGETLAVAAEALGISVEELKAELKGGKSIADVAGEQGVDVDSVIDALVADGLARLQEAQEALPERVTELVNRSGWGKDRPDRPGHHRPKLHGLQSAAEAIGITPGELKQALRDGATVAEVAADHDVDVDDVIDAMLEDVFAKIDEAVADGRLDEADAEEKKASVTERVTAFVNGEGPARGVRVKLDDAA